MAELVLRPTTEADDEAIAAVIAAAFPANPKADVDVLRWQYRRNPWGPTQGWVWEDAGQVVAHYSAFPMPLLLRGERTLVANAVDAAVLPSHQERRLFRPLARVLYDDCASRGMPVSFCFASNLRALRGVAAMGWREVARLRPHVLPVDDRWLARRFHAPRLAAGAVRRLAFRTGRALPAEVVSAAPEGLDELWSRQQPPANAVVHDRAWARWRYDDSPLGPYRHLEVRREGRLVGWAAVLERADFGGRFGCLLDLLADDVDAARSLVRGAAELDVDGVAGLAVDGSLEAMRFRRAGLRPLPRRLEPRAAYFGVVDNAGGLVGIEREPWSVSWSDLDHL
jgi:hypothetical protein